MDFTQLGKALAMTGAFAALGLVFFALAFWLMEKLTPFSVRKEIETDQNTALAIIMGSVIIGIALIVAAAVHG
jgi:putative membrane protein